MKNAILVSAIIFALSGCNAESAASDAEYDDPAVAVCEWDLKRRVDGNGNYQRISADVSGLEATIRFTLTVLNIRPKEQTRICEYELRDGVFSLKTPQVPKACIRMGTPRWNADRRLGRLTEDDLQLQENCDAAKSANTAAQQAQKPIAEQLGPLGIYPIDATDTALSAE